ncbi:hypothetical protein CP556_21175 [Natrinema sp. CBA1119]|nr:hypothetical protein CP556_21175 [Natrinema sp. CBA1119]
MSALRLLFWTGILITAYLLFYNSMSTDKSAINLVLHATIAIFCMSAILSSVFDSITCYWSYFWMVALFSVMSSPLVYGLVFKHKSYWNINNK